MYFLFILLLPVLVLAQNNTYQDSVISYNGNVTPCRVIGLDDSKVSFIYGKNVREKIVLDGVKRLVIDSFGNGINIYCWIVSGKLKGIL